MTQYREYYDDDDEDEEEEYPIDRKVYIMDDDEDEDEEESIDEEDLSDLDVSNESGLVVAEKDKEWTSARGRPPASKQEKVKKKKPYVPRVKKTAQAAAAAAEALKEQETPVVLEEGMIPTAQMLLQRRRQQGKHVIAEDAGPCPICGILINGKGKMERHVFNHDNALSIMQLYEAEREPAIVLEREKESFDDILDDYVVLPKRQKKPAIVPAELKGILNNDEERMDRLSKEVSRLRIVDLKQAEKISKMMEAEEGEEDVKGKGKKLTEELEEWEMTDAADAPAVEEAEASVREDEEVEGGVVAAAAATATAAKVVVQKEEETEETDKNDEEEKGENEQLQEEEDDDDDDETDDEEIDSFRVHTSEIPRCISCGNLPVHLDIDTIAEYIRHLIVVHEVLLWGVEFGAAKSSPLTHLLPQDKCTYCPKTELTPTKFFYHMLTRHCQKLFAELNNFVFLRMRLILEDEDDSFAIAFTLHKMYMIPMLASMDDDMSDFPDLEIPLTAEDFEEKRVAAVQAVDMVLADIERTEQIQREEQEKAETLRLAREQLQQVIIRPPMMGGPPKGPVLTHIHQQQQRTPILTLPKPPLLAFQQQQQHIQQFHEARAHQQQQLMMIQDDAVAGPSHSGGEQRTVTMMMPGPVLHQPRQIRNPVTVPARVGRPPGRVPMIIRRPYRPPMRLVRPQQRMVIRRVTPVEPKPIVVPVRTPGPVQRLQLAGQRPQQFVRPPFAGGAPSSSFEGAGGLEQERISDELEGQQVGEESEEGGIPGPDDEINVVD